MLAFYLNDQSSNPTEFLKYYYIKLLEKKENKQKEAVKGPLIQKN